MKFYPFSEVIADSTSKFRKIKASDYKDKGRFRIIDQGQKAVAGYTDDSSLVNRTHSPIIIFGDHTRALKYENSPIALGADGAKALSVNPKIANPLYIYYYLRTINLKGAGYSRHFKFLKKIEIPIPEKNGEPNFNEQIRIAHLLSKVEGLIAQRKQHLQQLDDLLKSMFLEMFGDPVRNEKGWDVGTSSSYAEKVMVGVVIKPASHYVESGVIALRSLNIKPNRIDLNDLVYFSQESNDGMLSKSKLQANDVVVVRTGKTGTAAVIPQELDGANCIDLIIVRPKHDILNPKYLASLLNSERGMKLVSGLEVGGIQKHFNVGALNKIPFPLPPIDGQNQFANIVEKVETLKSRYQHSLTDLESLYGALSQQAFKGELDLSQVPLPEPEQPADEVAIAIPEPEVADKTMAIHLPESDILLAALTDETKRNDLFAFWLESYCQQIGNTPFSASKFIAAAQTRIAELHPDNELEFGLEDYDQIKHWIFKALNSECLQQAQNVTGQDENGDPILGNKIELKAGIEL